jgi:hypothetical protein
VRGETLIFERLAIWLAPFLLLVGCHSAHVAEPLTQKFGGNAPEAQMDFWHALGERPVTCNDEAFHGLLLYVDGQDPANDYAGRVDLLKSRRMLPQHFDKPAEEAVQRGVLAAAIARALNIKGGLTMHLLGPLPRYATRELMYAGIYPPSSARQTFSGAEFLGIMGKVEDWQRGNPANVPAAVLPGEARQLPRE